MKTNLLQKNIPKGWEIKKIKDLLDFEQPTKYIVESSSYTSDGKTPVLTANKSFVLGYTNETDGVYTNTPAIIFDDFTTDSKYVDFPFKIKSSAIKILTNRDENTDLKFVYEIMKSFNFPIANHKRHYISQYQELDIVVPSTKEQKKIAEILSSVDEEIQKVEEIISATEKLKKNLLRELFSNNSDWQNVSIKDLGEIITGSTPKTSQKENYGGDFIWVSPKDITGQKHLSNSEKKLSKIGFETTRKVPSGSILIVCIGSTIGKMSIASKELSTNQQINSLVVNDSYDKDFIYYALNFYKSKIFEKVSTQAVPIINKTALSSINFLIPKDKNKQVHISRLLSSIDEKNTVNQKLKLKLLELKKGLVSDLLSGKVRTINN